jgi:hypothetical protein
LVTQRLRVVIAIDKRALGEDLGQEALLKFGLLGVGIEVRVTGRDQLDVVVLDDGVPHGGWLAEDRDEERQLRLGAQSGESAISIRPPAYRLPVTASGSTPESVEGRGRTEYRGRVEKWRDSVGQGLMRLGRQHDSCLIETWSAVAGE